MPGRRRPRASDDQRRRGPTGERTRRRLPGPCWFDCSPRVPAARAARRRRARGSRSGPSRTARPTGGSGRGARSSPMGSSRASVMVSRSARRHTVRATWSCAAPADPPGSTKFVSGPTTALSSSMRRSRLSTWCGWTVGMRVAPLVVLGPAQVGTEVEQLVLDALELGRQAVGQAQRERDPDRGVELVDRAVGTHPRASPWTRGVHRRGRSCLRRRSSCRSSSVAACDRSYPTDCAAGARRATDRERLPHSRWPANIRRS